jgi:ABC-type arginine transport system permease subunit
MLNCAWAMPAWPAHTHTHRQHPRQGPGPTPGQGALVPFGTEEQSPRRCGQTEAARALGVKPSRTMRFIILPQALTITIPSQVNAFIGLFKDTTLVVVIGVFDFFTTLRAALGDPNWLGFPTEAYLFAAFVYFVLCFAMSRYSQSLEKSLRPESR